MHELGVWRGVPRHRSSFAPELPDVQRGHNGARRRLREVRHRRTLRKRERFVLALYRNDAGSRGVRIFREDDIRSPEKWFPNALICFATHNDRMPRRERAKALEIFGNWPQKLVAFSQLAILPERSNHADGGQMRHLAIIPREIRSFRAGRNSDFIEKIFVDPKSE